MKLLIKIVEHYLMRGMVIVLFLLVGIVEAFKGEHLHAGFALFIVAFLLNPEMLLTEFVKREELRRDVERVLGGGE